MRRRFYYIFSQIISFNKYNKVLLPYYEFIYIFLNNYLKILINYLNNILLADKFSEVSLIPVYLFNSILSPEE